MEIPQSWGGSRETSAERFTRIEKDVTQYGCDLTREDAAFLIMLVEKNAAEANYQQEERERFRKASVSLSRYLSDAVEALRKIRDRDYHVWIYGVRSDVCEQIAREALESAPNWPEAPDPWTLTEPSR